MAGQQLCIEDLNGRVIRLETALEIALNKSRSRRIPRAPHGARSILSRVSPVSCT
jgi:hypothetical protein